jgi:hypothetical protein
MEQRGVPMTQDSLMIFPHNQRLQTFSRKYLPEKRFQINQDNTSVQKVGALFHEFLQELCSNFTETNALELGCTRLPG